MNRLARLTMLLPIMLAACGTAPKSGGSAAAPAPADSAKSSESRLTPEDVSKRKADILAMRDETLAELFEQKPEARDELKNAVGYAVFDSFQFNVLMFVAARGRGVLIDNATQTPTFMVASRAGSGPGVGYKSFRQLMIFKSQSVFDQFRTVGADLTASADATAKLGDTGAKADLAHSFNPFITLYQFTDRGMLLQANWGGAAYLPDSELN